MFSILVDDEEKDHHHDKGKACQAKCNGDLNPSKESKSLRLTVKSFDAQKNVIIYFTFLKLYIYIYNNTIYIYIVFKRLNT